MQEYQHTGRRLKHNKTTQLPRNIIAISVESRQMGSPNDANATIHYWHSASCVFGRVRDGCNNCPGSITFVTRDRLWRWIYSQTGPRYTTWLIGTDILAQLIIAGLPDRFQSCELHIDKPRSKRAKDNDAQAKENTSTLAVLENPPTIIGCRVVCTQGRLVIVDTLNWFPGELSTGTESKGHNRPVSGIDGNPDDRTGPANTSAAMRVYTTFTQLITWIASNDMGVFKYTASSQAMAAYRHRFMRQAIYVHDNNAIQGLERQSYFGGRFEVFRIGALRETVYQIDCNSLFPSVMQSLFFPYYLDRYEERPEMVTLRPAIRWENSIAEVMIVTDKPLYPYRTERAIVYPKGRVRTVLAGPELYRAIRSGIVVAVGTWAEYKTAPIFSDYVTELWRLRQQYRAEGNRPYETFTKQLLNSLYGKFAQLTPSWVDVPNDYSLLPWSQESHLDGATGEWATLRSVGWQVQKQVERTIREGSFYAIASFVTAYARVRMDNLRAVAGRRNVYYQGVDSLIVNAIGYRNLCEAGEVHPTELGKLRLEYTAENGSINGVSDYDIGEKITLSGKSKQTTTLANGTLMQSRRYISKHLFRNGPIDTVTWESEPWQRHATYTKGQVQPDGWVEPLELDCS